MQNNKVCNTELSSAGSKSALAPTFATINGVVLKELHIRKSDLCVGNLAT